MIQVAVPPGDEERAVAFDDGAGGLTVSIALTEIGGPGRTFFKVTHGASGRSIGASFARLADASKARDGMLAIDGVDWNRPFEELVETVGLSTRVRDVVRAVQGR